jgi:hypothetical protein
MASVEKGFADNSDDRRISDVKLLSRASVKGNRVRVQLKTMLRISHHCGFAGISTTMIPGFIASRILKRNVNVAVCKGSSGVASQHLTLNRNGSCGDVKC